VLCVNVFHAAFLHQLDELEQLCVDTDTEPKKHAHKHAHKHIRKHKHTRKHKHAHAWIHHTRTRARTHTHTHTHTHGVRGIPPATSTAAGHRGVSPRRAGEWDAAPANAASPLPRFPPAHLREQLLGPPPVRAIEPRVPHAQLEHVCVRHYGGERSTLCCLATRRPWRWPLPL